ncbi:phage holin family protein [Paenibacillus motobuensis]|uniref:phage holin family protein n=1 Tax=Paenibacillus TaxID=44249 RepID=UPI00203DEB66|nr:MULTISPECIES: phage holin family protein [Paenibacillus]MCM3040001.1 phage holin family protein [Paenibacillus lutimineralis]MCM3647105.1 phage holin family protein [Paenibacillus motobuensis]
MKKLSGVLLMILSIGLLLFGIVGFIGGLASSEVAIGIIAVVILIVPGVLLLVMSIRMVDAKKQLPINMAGYPQGRPENPGNYNRMPNGGPYGNPNSNQPGSSAQGTVNRGFDPLDARSVNDYVQEQIKQASNQGVRTVTTSYVYTSSTENGNSVNAFPGGASSVAGGAPKVPVSVECPGCGAVATVPPDRSVKCDFCGAVVPYKETTT